jgi:ABC-type molybdenum transport system ATPase subunit/photorepair protein PhrA/GNAT superfamily N-acetyltransferase
MQITTALKADIKRTSDIIRSGRVLQLEGMFDVAPAEQSALSWNVTLPLHERDWNIGLIVGPSGCGKSTIARELFGDAYVHGFDWDEKKALIDSFPDNMGVKDITLLLSSVGFSSPPSWLRPFHVLSNGEQFRATIARALAEKQQLAVIDEFTSVVDRTVAKIGSTAIAKTVRRNNGKFVAVSCHYDIQEWLDPDWIYEPASNTFLWRSLRCRPPIELEISRISHEAWSTFAPHHYLTSSLNTSAFCFGAFIDGQIVAFDAWLPFFGRLAYGKARRGHRTVCLPDYQGVGIGNALFETVSAMWRGLGYRAFSGTGHPAEIAKRKKSQNWKMTSAPSRHARGNHSMDKTRATNRLVASFEHIGKPMPHEQAQALFNGR